MCSMKCKCADPGAVTGSGAVRTVHCVQCAVCSVLSVTGYELTL